MALENLLDEPEGRRNPYPIYSQLRALRSLRVDPRVGYYTAWDYATVRKILRDSDTFASGMVPPGARLAEWLTFMDPPRHTRFRALVSKAFTPRAVAAQQEAVQTLSRRLLAPHLPAGQIDWVKDYAAPLPLMVIAEMLGVPLADVPRVRRWSDVVISIANNLSADPGLEEKFLDVHDEMEDYLEVMVRQRQRPGGSGDDLLSALMRAEVDGERLAPEELLGFFQILLVAGHETSSNFLANAMVCFLDYPDQRQQLQSDWGLLEPAIEEILRFHAPLTHLGRLVRRDVELLGTALPPGCLVQIFLASANRDPERFAHPDQLDFQRDPNPHLSFGYGIHGCVGSALNRLEARIALPDMLTLLEDVQLASDQPWEPRANSAVYGPASLPLRFKPRSL